MRFMISIFASVAITAAAALRTGAAAEPSPDAYALFAAGDYETAATLAEAAGGAENLTLAARALNAASYFEPDRKTARRTAKRGLKFAQAAIETDPELPEAHLQEAISYALWGANTSSVKSVFANLPGRAREAIDAALSLDPENPWALSTSAAWRLEVHRLGGGRIYGADPEIGRREFLASRERAPSNVAVAYECALRMIAADRDEWRDDALACLDAAIALSPETKFESDLQGRAVILNEALRNGDDAVGEVVEQFG